MHIRHGVFIFNYDFRKMIATMFIIFMKFFLSIRNMAKVGFRWESGTVDNFLVA